MNALGIDIGGSSIKVSLLVDEREVWAATSARYERPALSEVGAALRNVLGVAPWEAAGGSLKVGLCVPGAYDAAARRITQSVNMPGLVGADLDGLVGSALGERALTLAGCVICSDAHAAAYDVWVLDPRPGRLLAISLGTGVGACVLDGGRALRITGQSSGHLGQVDVTVPGIEPTPVGPDGGRGILEAYIGLPVIRRRYGDPATWLESLTGDEPEVAALARAIRIAHAIYRPERVVLLGGVGVRLRTLLPRIKALVEDGLTGLARPGWTLASGWDDHHAARGAARLAGADDVDCPVSAHRRM